MVPQTQPSPSLPTIPAHGGLLHPQMVLTHVRQQEAKQLPVEQEVLSQLQMMVYAYYIQGRFDSFLLDVFKECNTKDDVQTLLLDMLVSDPSILPMVFLPMMHVPLPMYAARKQQVFQRLVQTQTEQATPGPSPSPSPSAFLIGRLQIIDLLERTEHMRQVHMGRLYLSAGFLARSASSPASFPTPASASMPASVPASMPASVPASAPAFAPACATTPFVPDHLFLPVPTLDSSSLFSSTDPVPAASDPSPMLSSLPIQQEESGDTIASHRVPLEPTEPVQPANKHLSRPKVGQVFVLSTEGSGPVDEDIHAEWTSPSATQVAAENFASRIATQITIESVSNASSSASSSRVSTTLHARLEARKRKANRIVATCSPPTTAGQRSTSRKRVRFADQDVILNSSSYVEGLSTSTPPTERTVSISPSKATKTTKATKATKANVPWKTPKAAMTTKRGKPKPVWKASPPPPFHAQIPTLDLAVNVNMDMDMDMDHHIDLRGIEETIEIIQRLPHEWIWVSPPHLHEMSSSVAPSDAKTRSGLYIKSLFDFVFRVYYNMSTRARTRAHTRTQVTTQQDERSSPVLSSKDRLIAQLKAKGKAKEPKTKNEKTKSTPKNEKEKEKEKEKEPPLSWERAQPMIRLMDRLTGFFARAVSFEDVSHMDPIGLHLPKDAWDQLGETVRERAAKYQVSVQELESMILSELAVCSLQMALHLFRCCAPPKWYPFRTEVMPHISSCLGVIQKMISSS